MYRGFETVKSPENFAPAPDLPNQTFQHTSSGWSGLEARRVWMRFLFNSKKYYDVPGSKHVHYSYPVYEVLTIV